MWSKHIARRQLGASRACFPPCREWLAPYLSWLFISFGTLFRISGKESFMDGSCDRGRTITVEPSILIWAMCIQHIGIANLSVFPRALGRYKGSKTIFLPQSSISSRASPPLALRDKRRASPMRRLFCFHITGSAWVETVPWQHSQYTAPQCADASAQPIAFCGKFSVRSS